MKITTFITSLIFLCAGICCPPEQDRNYENSEFDAPEASLKTFKFQL